MVTDISAVDKPLVGIFGGTFDPVHSGHLASVDLLVEHLGFARVYWVLSARPPHKDHITASIEHRFEMLRRVLDEHAELRSTSTQDQALEAASACRYIADASEADRSEKSYTIDTVEAFATQFPSDKLCLIIGADSLHNLPTWHRYSELIDKVHWVVMNRPGYSMKVPTELSSRVVKTPAQLIAKSGRIMLFNQSDFAISSTELRTELAKPQGYNAKLVKQFLPSAVINYIRAKQLYKIETMNPEQIKDRVVDSLESVKAQDIRVIEISDISDFADFMVVASGTSDTHVKALAREASTNLRQNGVKPLNEDGADVGEWVLVDFGDVVLHVMRPEVREYYDLEKLWDQDVRNMVKAHRESRED